MFDCKNIPFTIVLFLMISESLQVDDCDVPHEQLSKSNK